MIEKRLKQKGVVEAAEDEMELPEDATTNVVDFMALLKDSIESNKRTPAKKAPATKAARKRVSKRKPPATTATKKSGTKAAAKAARSRPAAKTRKTG